MYIHKYSIELEHRSVKSVPLKRFDFYPSKKRFPKKREKVQILVNRTAFSYHAQNLSFHVRIKYHRWV